MIRCSVEPERSASRESSILRQGWHLRAGTSGERIDGPFRRPASSAILKFPAGLTLINPEGHVRLLRNLRELVNDRC
jgi:hypothetical protein